MTLPQLLRHRRATVRREEAHRRNRQLLAAAAELRARAMQEVTAGRPDLARPFEDEAELFEAATVGAIAL